MRPVPVARRWIWLGVLLAAVLALNEVLRAWWRLDLLDRLLAVSLAFVRRSELISPLPILVRTLPEDLELD